MSETLGNSFEALVDLLKELREKCPWDKVQTNETLRRFTIEELYELIEALETNNVLGIQEELGDMLTHIIFYANLAEEKKQFSLKETIDKNTQKLINRHPHIYGDGSVQMKDDNEVEKNWEKLKGKEGKSMFGGLPKSLPPITKSHKLIDKAMRFGFKWKTPEDAYRKIHQELEELKASTKNDQQEEEIGDVLFSIINYAHLLGIDPDRALARTNTKFQSRIEHIESVLHKKGKTMNHCTLEELMNLWNDAKLQNK